MKKILFFLAVFFSVQSFAVEWNKNSDFLWNASTGKVDTFPGAGSGQVWDGGQVKPSAFGPTFQRQKSLPFNPSPKADFKATFKPAAMAKGLLNPTSALITMAGAALLNQLLNEACVRVFGGGMQIAAGGEWEECKMVDSVSVEYTAGGNSWPAAQRGKGATPVAACSAAASKNSTEPVVSGYQQTQKTTYTVNSSSPTSCNLKLTTETCNTSNGSCVTYVPNPAAEVGMTSASVTTQVQDGWKPSTLAAVEPKVTAKLDAWSQSDFLYGKEGLSGQASGVVDAVMKSGNGIEPDVTVSGPSSMPGTVTTTMNSNNTTTTTTTTNNYTYGKQSPVASSVTNNVTTTVTTVDNSTGAVVSNTTTNETGKETEDACVKNPDTIGCAKLGDVPEAEVLTDKATVVTVTAAAFASSSACPAPLGFDVIGHHYAFSYQGMCDRLAMLKFLFLMMGGIVAAYILADSFKVT